MQINIKLKFDHKKNKSQAAWDKNSKLFFLDNCHLKNKQKQTDINHLHSFRQYRQTKYASQQEAIKSSKRLLNKEINKVSKPRNHHSSVKRCRSKQTKQVSEPSKLKITHAKKVSIQPVKTKHKKNIFSNSNLVQQQPFRGSLPGLSGKKVLQRFAPILSQNQKVQLINQKTVYYIGMGAQIGHDDQQGTYLWKKHEQVSYRYQLLQCLGSGTFGEVIKAFDHKNKENVAIKIIRSKKQHMQLALNEINILMRAKQRDIENQKNIVRIKDFIVFRRHICIVTQLLSISLYQLMELNRFQSIQMHYIRTFAIQILNGLVFLKENNIIHADLKPENVLLKNKSKTGLKLIDFGTSMFGHEATYMYIQSRFYRAPEVLLGTEYDFSIDMWSFGCLIAQLYLGEPLFPGQNEQQQLSLIMQMIGEPPREYLKKCKNAKSFFKEDYKLVPVKNRSSIQITPGSKPISLQISDKSLAGFLSKVFLFMPNERLKPLDALLDPWILEGLPQNIREQHLSYIKLKIKDNFRKSQSIEDRKSPQKQLAKKHKKRNSDYCARQTKVGHHRRRSDGLM